MAHPRPRRRDQGRICLRTGCGHMQAKHERGDDRRMVGACHGLVSNDVDGVRIPRMCDCAGFVGENVGANKERKGF